MERIYIEAVSRVLEYEIPTPGRDFEDTVSDVANLFASFAGGDRFSPRPERKQPHRYDLEKSFVITGYEKDPVEFLYEISEGLTYKPINSYPRDDDPTYNLKDFTGGKIEVLNCILGKFEDDGYSVDTSQVSLFLRGKIDVLILEKR